MPGFSFFIHFHSGSAPSPFTSTLAMMGNDALNTEHTSDSICSSVPGSCPANWLHGKPAGGLGGPGQKR